LLRVAAPGLDPVFSARPVAREIVRLQPENVPVAAYKISRELEYGLSFYLDRPIARYERNESPARSHLLIVHSFNPDDLEVILPHRNLTLLGEFPSQQLTFYWVAPR